MNGRQHSEAAHRALIAGMVALAAAEDETSDQAEALRALEDARTAQYLAEYHAAAGMLGKPGRPGE